MKQFRVWNGVNDLGNWYVVERLYFGFFWCRVGEYMTKSEMLRAMNGKEKRQYTYYKLNNKGELNEKNQ